MKVDIDLMKYRGNALRAYLWTKRTHIAASRKFREPLSNPHCGDWTPPGLIARTVRFKSGNVKVVRLHAQVFVAFLKALAVLPTLEVTATATSPYSGSYRSYRQQWWLRDQYLHNDGHLAADPCTGYHRTGRAMDLIDGGEDKVEDAMTEVRVDGERFYHGDVFGDPPHYSWAELG